MFACVIANSHTPLFFFSFQVLYPALKELAGDDHLSSKALTEHAQVRAELNLIGQSELTDPHIAELVQKLFDDVMSHVSAEEAHIFPLLR